MKSLVGIGVIGLLIQDVSFRLIILSVSGLADICSTARRERYAIRCATRTQTLWMRRWPPQRANHKTTPLRPTVDMPFPRKMLTASRS